MASDSMAVDSMASDSVASGSDCMVSGDGGRDTGGVGVADTGEAGKSNCSSTSGDTGGKSVVSGIASDVDVDGISSTVHGIASIDSEPDVEGSS